MIHLHGTLAVAFRVLIIDTDAIERAILSRCVEMLGWTADTANGLDDAIAPFLRRPHDVVVIDTGIPRRDQEVLLRSLRQDRADPVLIFVADAGDHAAAETLPIAREFGLRTAGVLPRPIDPYRLHALMLTPLPREPRGHPPRMRWPRPRELDRALREGEIRVEFQPKTDLATGEIAGVEALARWHSPTLGTIPPSHFVPIAEQSGLIGRLTFHVVEQAMAACRQWRRARPDCAVSVNVSPFVLSDPSLWPTLESILTRNGLTPDALIVEISETALLAHMPRAADVLSRLACEGVRVSMDGFGTGYTSLQSLLRMPFTELKIDRSFVGVCRTDAEAWKLVRATVSLARILGVHVVAEGIESEDVSDRLRDAGCDMGQGWYFGRPMGDDAVLRLLKPAARADRLHHAALVADLLTAPTNRPVAAE